MKRGKIWGLLFLILACFTVWVVISNTESFSLSQFTNMLQEASDGWMIAAVFSMLGYIFFEGMALLCIIKAFGYHRGTGRGFLYSAADIYFSAITPSATGGQPASAFFMMKDGIPGGVVTISLVANLIMYTLAILTVGTVGVVVRPSVFFHFDTLSRIFIVAGYLLLSGLAVSFYLLIAKPRILEGICEIFVKLGKKIHLIRDEIKIKDRLYHAMREYQECADVMADHKPMFVKAFLFNLLQRMSQITVTLLVYLSIGGHLSMAADIWFTQSFVAIGAYSVPIPGGMGVADYLLIDGFQAFFDEATAVNLELLCRGVAFYVCIIVSAVTVLFGMICTMKKRSLR